MHKSPFNRPKPVTLVILDGWGHREAMAHNAIAKAKTPAWDALLREYPHGLINASEGFVGLPEGQMGNSEVGHMNIGSGRVVVQDLSRIDQAIEDGSLARNPALLEFVRKVKAGTGVVHLMGLLSPGGVHAHQHHMAALANILAGQGLQVKVHAFLDGRDTPPKSALEYLKEFESEIYSSPHRGEARRGAGEATAVPLMSLPQPSPVGGGSIAIATVCGRYYAMDRDKRWDRVGKTYDAVTAAAGPRADSAQAAIEQSYAQNAMDEFVIPTAIGDYAGMHDGDGLLMANFRADRAREILQALLDPAFDGFTRKYVVKFSAALGMAEYSETHNQWMATLFPPEKLTHIFGEVISEAGLKQLRIAETEKYAHVTFFFNGGREEPFPGEERILVPSPNVATYDLKPEMSAYEVTEKLEEAIASGRFDVIVVNYANTDMVGHTGDIDAAAKAVEAVDTCLGRLTKAVLAKGGTLLITADHGNAESMFDESTHQPHTAHTTNLVPVVLVDARLKGKKMAIPEGKLADVAPTLLQWLGLPQPPEMTGRPLLSEKKG